MQNENQLKRDVRKIGVRTIATKSGVSRYTIYRWLRGEVSPMAKNYLRIYEAVRKTKAENRSGFRRFFAR